MKVFEHFYDEDKNNKSNNAWDIFNQKNYLNVKNKIIVTINQTMCGMSLLNDNIIIPLSDNKKYVDDFNKMIANNPKYNKDSYAEYISFDNKNKDINSIYIIDALKKMKEKGLKDVVVFCNLPYGKLYIKMLIEMQKFIENGLISSITGINPSRPWDSKEYYVSHMNDCKILFKHLEKEKLEIIDHDTFCKKIFSIGNAVPGNGCIVNFNKSINNDIESCITEVLFKNDEMFKNILVKIFKCDKKISSIYGGPRKDPKESHNVKYLKFIRMPFHTKIYSWHITDNYKDSILCKDGDAGSIIGFETKIEQDNFEKSLNSWVYKFVFDACIDDLAKIPSIAPWLEDYTEEWTDEKLFEYFDITEEEKEYIINYMNT